MLIASFEQHDQHAFERLSTVPAQSSRRRSSGSDDGGRASSRRRPARHYVVGVAGPRGQPGTHPSPTRRPALAALRTRDRAAQRTALPASAVGRRADARRTAAVLTAFTAAEACGLHGWERDAVHILVPSGTRLRAAAVQQRLIAPDALRTALRRGAHHSAPSRPGSRGRGHRPGAQALIDLVRLRRRLRDEPALVAAQLRRALGLWSECMPIVSFGQHDRHATDAGR